MKALLLGGYRPFDQDEPMLPVAQRISELQQLGLEVICVLAGQSADELLRKTPEIAMVELVFDTHDQGTLLTNVQSGLAACPGEACFILPVEVPPPAPEAWSSLRQALRSHLFHEPIAALQMAPSKGAPFHVPYGFPLLITRMGNELFSQTKDLTGLNDPRIKYLELLPSMETPFKFDSLR